MGIWDLKEKYLISESFPEEAAAQRGEADTEGDEGRLRPFLTPRRVPSSSPPRTRSSRVFLEIDNRQCVQDSDQCFKSTDAAAALLASHAIQGTLSYPLVSVVSEWHCCGGRRGQCRPGHVQRASVSGPVSAPPARLQNQHRGAGALFIPAVACTSR